jgi:anti-anti-sigma factor
MAPQTLFPVRVGDGRIVVLVNAQLTSSSAADFARLVMDLLAGHAEREIVFEFAGCAFIDATGLKILVSLRRVILGDRRTLAITGLNDGLRILFGLTKLDTLFAIDGPQSHGGRRDG